MNPTIAKENIIKLVTRATEEFKAKNKSLLVPSKKIPKDIEVLMTAIDEFGGSSVREPIRKLVEVLTGKKIPHSTRGKRLSIEPLTAIVPLSNGNGHSYPIGKVTICRREGWHYMLRDNREDHAGLTGNQMDDGSHGLRPATEEEIKERINALSSGDIETLIDGMIIVG